MNSRFTRSSAALVIIDMQYDFMPGGALAVPDGDGILPTVNALAAEFTHVVLTQDWHPQGHASFASEHPGKQPFERILLPYGDQTLWPDHCIQGSEGAALHRNLQVPHAQLVIRKGYNPQIDSYSAFLEADRTTPTGLTGYLHERGIETLYLCGLALDFCVAWSALDARARGFSTYVVEDACRAINLEGSAEAVRHDMRNAGVQLVHSDTLLPPALSR